MSRLRIVLLTPNYRPESNAGAQRLTSLAEHLAAEGHQVVAVTSQPHHPQNRIYEGYEVRSPHVDHVAGVKVIRLRPWLVPKDSLPLRMFAEALFTLQALTHLLRAPADVIMASSPYMFLGPVGLFAARLRGLKFVWDVRDLTWLYPKAAGKRTFGIDVLLDCLMRFTAARSDALTTATEGLFSYFDSRPSVAACIPNGVNDDWLDRLTSLPAPPLDEPPLVSYAGLFGYNHGVSTIVEAAEFVPEARFLLVGDGPERQALMDLVDSRGLTNVDFGGYLDQERLQEVYRRSSVLVSHVRANPIFLWTQPAKVWEYMASGRPVVHAGEGEVLPIIEDHHIGLVVPPEQPAALAAGIRRVLDDRRLAQELGANARAFVSENRRRSRLNDRFVKVLERVSRGRG
ncbi:MAG TPA: glycosyltransferase family 4 protein [Trueperaceae bacterium]|nr:glycosyltransferase family 4 protein [Trueperaceae bacterium]